MRNNIPLWGWKSGDGAGGVNGYGLDFTLDQAQANYDAINMGGGAEQPPSQYWALLNKWNVQGFVSGYLNFIAGNLSFMVSAGLLTQDQDVARNFGIDNVPGGVWQTDGTETWVDNVKIADEVHKEQPTRRIRLRQLSLLQSLAEIYAILVVKPNPDAQLRKLLRDLLTLIRHLTAGTATQAEIDAVNKELTALTGSL